MEFQFHELKQKESKLKENNKLKSSSRSNGTKSKFVGVRQRPSGKWVAEIKNTTQKIRIWLGTFDTAEEAAHAYDEAACLLRGSNTRTNFVISPSSDNNSALSRRIRNLVNQKKNLINSYQPPPTGPPTTTSGKKATDGTVADTSLVLNQPLSFTGQMHDENAYRPNVSRQFDYSWAFPEQFPPIPDDLGIFTKQLSFTALTTDAGMGNGNERAMLEFERMKVERQISASLYAINGVNDYLQSVFNACDTHDSATPSPAWDPPMLYHNFCLG